MEGQKGNLESSQRCNGCKDGEGGLQEREIEAIVRIETMMVCGCGGYVTHWIGDCQTCGKYYLASYEEHWPPHSEDYYVDILEVEGAMKLIERIRQCKNLEDRRCDCEIHRESESLHWGKTVKRVFEEHESQKWD